MPGTRLIDKFATVIGLHAVTPSSSSPKWVSLKGYNHLTVLIPFENATTVTGSAIGLQQATDVSGTGAKALAFTTAWKNIDDSSNANPTNFAVSSNTFTLDNTNSKKGYYVIEVDADDLDVNNGFDCVQLTVGNATAQTVGAIYLLSGARYGGGSYGPYTNPQAN